jgi:hypothetical protein
MTITSDPERPAATAGGAAEGTMRIDPTLMFAVKTRTDPDASVPVALNVNVPDADVGIVTFAESAPVTSVSAVANSIGADVTDSIVTWTGVEEAKPPAATVITVPAGGLAFETVNTPEGPYWARTACDPSTRRRNAAAIAT